MKTSLKRLVLIAVTAVAAAVVAVLTVFDIASDARIVEKRVKATAERLATVTAPLVLSAMVVDDLATVEQALHVLNAESAFTRVVLLSPDRKMQILDTSPARPRLSTAPRFFRDLLGVRLDEVRVIVQGGGVVYGILAVTPSPHLVEDEAWGRALWDLFGAAVLLGLILLALTVVVTRGLAPLGELARTAARFGWGDRTARMREGGVTEIADLARAFNGMAVNLDRALTDLGRNVAANRRLAAAVAQAGEAIVTLDTDHRVLTWNRGAESLIGESEVQVAGRRLGEILRPIHAPEGGLDRLFAPAGAGVHELLLRRGTEEIHVEASATELTDADGARQGWVVVIRDVSARKRGERELFEAKRVAELSNRSKSEFLANMSHELRTPLNAVIGFSSMMKSGVFGPLGAPKYRDYVDDINHAATHLLELINDLLDISAIEADRLELRESEFELGDSIAAALRLLRSRLDASGLALTLNQARPPIRLRADERRIKQILLNLLSNAIKFTPKGGVVTLASAVRADGEVAIAISDTGIGMDDAGIVRALERFGQVDSGLNRKHDGSGLGLPLTASLVARHGGRLDIASVPGRGTTVTVTLPRERLVRAGPAPLRVGAG